MSIEGLIADASVGIEAISEHLDSMAPDARWADVGTCHETCRGHSATRRPSHGPHLCTTSSGRPLPWSRSTTRGRNTLPVPDLLRHFVKPFVRLPEEASRAFGYYETPVRRLIRPGYFVAYETAGNPGWQARGGVVVDYFQSPSAQPPAGWPPIVPNSRGLQRYIYGGTRDFLRRVSSHVTIGAVFKADRPMDHYFVLCRAP